VIHGAFELAHTYIARALSLLFLYLQYTFGLPGRIAWGFETLTVLWDDLNRRCLSAGWFDEDFFYISGRRLWRHGLNDRT
jgi:hypothetical protein